MVVEFVTPFRDRTLELLDDQKQLSAVLEQGRQQATEVAEATLARRLAAGRVRGARPPWPHCWVKVSKVFRVPVIGVALSIPEPWASTAAGLPHRPRPGGRPDPHPHHARPAHRDRRRRPRGRRGAPRQGRRGRVVVRRAPARHRHLPAGLAGRLRQPGPGDLADRAARRRRTVRAARRRRRVPLPPPRDRRPPPVRRPARPRLRRPRGLRVHLRGDRLPPLRPRRRRRLAADPRLPARGSAADLCRG